jgi:NADH-quinone oxidoreductase subunit A
MENLLIFMGGTLFGLMLLYFLGVAVAPYRPNRVKQDHFECGLPPSSDTPQKIKFSYFLFAVMFIAVDIVGLFYSILLYSNEKDDLLYLGLFTGVVAIAISVAMVQYRKGETIK